MENKLRRLANMFWMVFAAAGLAVLQPGMAFAQSSKSPARDAHDSAQIRMRISETCKRHCYDCLYSFFPGMVNYCQGMRDWQTGSYTSALELLRLSASWDNKDAQYTLGLIYFNGHHVPVNHALGIAWLMLANERRNKQAIELALRSMMQVASPSESAQARKMFEKMRKRYGDQVAGARAWHRLRTRYLHASYGSGYARNFCITAGGASIPYTSGILNDPDVICVPSAFSDNLVMRAAQHYFDGLEGTVTVGSLSQVPAPTSSIRTPETKGSHRKAEATH